MERQVAALYEVDAEGRLAGSRLLGEPEATPRFFLGLTGHGNLWRFRADLPRERVRELARLAAAEPAPRDPDALPERDAALRERLEDDAPISRVFHGAAFRFPERLPDPGGAVELAARDAGLLSESFPRIAASLAERAPCTAVLEGSRAVSVCYAATRAAACIEAGVETLPGFRRRGLGGRVVAAWGRAARARGVVPLYSTSLANRASLRLARRTGLIRYGTDLHMR